MTKNMTKVTIIKTNIDQNFCIASALKTGLTPEGSKDKDSEYFSAHFKVKEIHSFSGEALD